MNVVVFGATGGTGQHATLQALARGHKVRAVARTPSAVKVEHENLTVLRGDVMDAASLEAVLSGQEAVLSALGVGNSLQPTTLYSAGTRNILEVMGSTGVRRFMGVSAGGFVADPNDTFFLKFAVKPLLKRVLKNPYADMKQMEMEVSSSDLDWTLVRPARLTSGPQTGRYRTVLNGNVPGGWTISRADVADYMVTHLNEPQVFGVAVGIAY